MTSQTGLPLNHGVVDASGNSMVFAQPWFYLFQSLWRKLGGQFSPTQGAVYAVQTGALEVTFYSSVNGVALGKVTLS